MIDYFSVGDLHRLLHTFFQQRKGDLALPLGEIGIALRDAIFVGCFDDFRILNAQVLANQPQRKVLYCSFAAPTLPSSLPASL